MRTEVRTDGVNIAMSGNKKARPEGQNGLFLLEKITS
jgi:hypothetical protein